MIPEIQPKFFIIDISPGETKKYIEGTTANVTLTNDIGQEIFQRSFNEKEEFLDFTKKHMVSFSGYSPVLATFIPPRTESLDELAKDLFFPVLVNHALKQEGTVKKVCGSFVGLSLDLLTLIPRVVALPFRMLYAYASKMERSDHPLVNVLKDNPEAISSQYLIAHMDIQIVEIEKQDKKGRKCFFANIKTRKFSKPIITNYNSPCPIQEEVEVQTSSVSYKGRIIDSAGHAYIEKAPTNSESYTSTLFHFFSGLEEDGIIDAAFSDL